MVVVCVFLCVPSGGVMIYVDDGHDPRHRKRLCIQGASLDGISAACNEILQEANESTFILIHVGTNDVKSTRL